MPWRTHCIWGPPHTWCASFHAFCSSRGQSLSFRNLHWVLGVPPSFHPSMWWVILWWPLVSSSPVSIAPHFPNLRRLDAFSYLPCLVNWLWIDLVVLSWISDLPMEIFPLLVIPRVSPIHGIWITPRWYKFPYLYHDCITHKLMIMDIMLSWTIFSLGCFISPWIFDQCSLNYSFYPSTFFHNEFI